MLSRLELELGRVDAARQVLAEADGRLELANRPTLNDYERELLWALESELRSICEALR